MPCHKLVDPRRDIRNCELARLVRQPVVRIVHRISEALHICMKPTLHHENPPPLRHANLLRLGFAGYVLVILGVGTRRFGMVGIHRQRHVEKNAWPQFRGFVSLNVIMTGSMLTTSTLPTPRRTLMYGRNRQSRASMR